MSNKKELGPEIRELHIRVDSLISRINKFDGLKILYSILDTADSELNEVFRAMEIEGRKDDPDVKFSHSNAMEHFYIVLNLINYFIEKSKNNKSSLNAVPVFVNALLSSNSPDFPGVQKVLSTYFDLSKVKLYHHDTHLPGINLTFRRYYALKNPEQFDSFNQIELCFKLINDFWQLTHSRDLMSKITIQEKTEKKPYFYFSDPDDVLASKNMTNRTIIENNLFPSWRVELIENRKETLSTTDKFRKETRNIEFLLRDLELEVAEFRKFSEFDSKFSGKYGIDIENYVKFSKAILSLSLEKIENTTILISQEELIKTISTNAGIKEDEIKKILSLFTNNCESIFEKPLIFDGKIFLFNWVTMVYPITYLFNKCYDQLIDNDLKGKEYEEEIRNVFRNQKKFVVDKRVNIELDIPEEIWGYKKTNTDIDVIGKSDEILFIVEGKTRNLAGQKINRLQKYCEKFYEELIYITWWIKENFSEFIENASKQHVKIPNDVKIIVPLVVSNFVTLQNNKFKTVNISELIEILKTENYEIKDSKVKLSLSADLEVEIPVFYLKDSH